jgi:hypothetical protein
LVCGKSAVKRSNGESTGPNTSIVNDRKALFINWNMKWWIWIELILSLVQTNILRLNCSFNEFSISEAETSGLKRETKRPLDFSFLETIGRFAAFLTPIIIITQKRKRLWYRGDSCYITKFLQFFNWVNRVNKICWTATSDSSVDGLVVRFWQNYFIPSFHIFKWKLCTSTPVQPFNTSHNNDGWFNYWKARYLMEKDRRTTSTCNDNDIKQNAGWAQSLSSSFKNVKNTNNSGAIFPTWRSYVNSNVMKVFSSSDFVQDKHDNCTLWNQAILSLIVQNFIGLMSSHITWVCIRL